MSSNRVLHLDVETYCELDLRSCGLENYLAHPSFTVTMMAWAFDDDERMYGRMWPDTVNLPAEIAAHIASGGELRAWNVAFERGVLKALGLDVAPEQCVCVMQKALAYGLPAKLLDAGLAMKAVDIKDESARSLMLQMSRPRKGNQPWHETDPLKLTRLAAYCMDDVRAERCLDGMIPELHPFERKLSLLDMRMNEKGVKVDIDAVAALMSVASFEEDKINAEALALSGRVVTKPGSQTQRLMVWFAAQGYVLPDVSKETIDGALKATHLRGSHVYRMLELRALAAKASTAKLSKMLAVASHADNRARNMFQFYGAGRTGRWAGRLIQPQNLPRVPKDWNAEQFIAACKTMGDVDLLWPRVLDCVSQSLRSMFVAESGKVLCSVDLSQIEARVLAWLAGQADVVEAFRRGEDVYTLAAAKIGSSNRQLGKVLTLACGFGMGWIKFKETAAAAPYWIDLTPQEAERHLWAWRNGNQAITGYWAKIEQTVGVSLANPGQVIPMSHGMAVRTWKGVTQIRKPNGVKLTYHRMRWEDGYVFDGVNSLSKKWGKEKAYGGRLVENIVQSVARDVMAEAMLASEEVPVMTVHDEIVWEMRDNLKVMLMQDVVETVPKWAPGLPLASELNVGFRYAK